ncbi:cobalamin-binding protein [Bacillus lacus]|uniref:Cobalamin-binding protein n=1 Tax=Metabacillus lacus TaxID=1983721 RepID=A0A7X2IY07_9BACI|nr:cobalamin-dependent protein [Metabacillus lacus]MRX71547.1 cobalamin-binding protein [Metabacillus lacus]
MNIDVVQELSKLLINGRISDSWELVNEHMTEESSSMDVYQLLTDTMYYIGQLWEENRVTVAQEHIASNVCKTIITNYFFEKTSKENNYQSLYSKNSRDRAMFFCVSGEEHDLGINMVANLFKEYGWDAKFLGSNLPLEDAVNFAEKWKPSVIGISVNIVYHLPQLIKYIEVLQELHHVPTILVGGKLASTYDLEFYCPEDTVIFSDLMQLKIWIQDMRTERHGNVVNI